ncbi:MAG: hypothetical protein AAGA46_12215 [Cyanobacteria bacterium P01_F01_bin.13]
MTDTISLTIDWRDADSDMPEEQQETLTQTVFQELRVLDEVEDIKRVADPDMPDGGMGANWLWSVLTAEITIDGIKQVCQDAYERLPGKPVEFTIEVEGKKIEAKNIRPDNLDETVDKLVEAVQKLKDS